MKVLGSSLCQRYSLELAANLKSYSLDRRDMSICLLDVVDGLVVVLIQRRVASSDIIITKYTYLEHPGHCGDDLRARKTMGPHEIPSNCWIGHRSASHARDLQPFHISLMSYGRPYVDEILA